MWAKATKEWCNVNGFLCVDGILLALSLVQLPDYINNTFVTIGSRMSAKEVPENLVQYIKSYHRLFLYSEKELSFVRMPWFDWHSKKLSTKPFSYKQ